MSLVAIFYIQIKPSGYKDPAESSYSRPTTQMYKSLKNLSQGEYMPSVERNTPMPAYTPSPMESSSYQPPKQGIPKSISYSNNFSASNTPDNVDMANRTMNTALNTSAIGTETTYNPGVGESNKDTSLHALRESNTPSSCFDRISYFELSKVVRNGSGSPSSSSGGRARSPWRPSASRSAGPSPGPTSSWRYGTG